MREDGGTLGVFSPKKVGYFLFFVDIDHKHFEICQLLNSDTHHKYNKIFR